MSDVRSKSRSKCRDTVEITVSIPKKLLIEYATEPVCMFQPKSDCRRAIDHAVQKALLDHYFKLFTGGGTNDPRG